MEDIDKNGDGFIDLDEYIGQYTRTASRSAQLDTVLLVSLGNGDGDGICIVDLCTALVMDSPRES